MTSPDDRTSASPPIDDRHADASPCEIRDLHVDTPRCVVDHARADASRCAIDHLRVDASRRALLSAGLGLACAVVTPAIVAAPRPSCARATGATPEEALVTLRGGTARGRRQHDGVHVFRGLRYGDDTRLRRFARALPERPWTGVRDAAESAPAAPQGGTDGPGDEDCLALDVFTPGLADGARRPVLVYFHGGGYDTGRASAALYDGSRLCRRGDVVVVCVGHRLNVFGHLHLADLGDGTFADSGNVGLLDLVDALSWLREHAGAFGGDRDNVTVFGQSGGGAKIATLMAMPAARGLFHRAWTMSGQQVTAAGPRAASQRAEQALERLGIARGDVARLRALPASRLLEATTLRDPSRVEDTRLYFGPVMDGRHLPRHPFWPHAPPQSAAIPMVIGNTRDETRAFLGRDPAHHALDWASLPDALRRHQFVDIDPATVIARYRALYPRISPPDLFFAATTAGRSWRGAVEELEARARQGAPTWSYQLDWPSPLEGGRLRALHTLDIALVFDNIDRPGALTGDGPAAQRMADVMSDALLAFARHGRPEHAGLPAWPVYGLAHRETMVFDTHSRIEHDPRGGERELYRQVPFIQRGTS